MRGRATLVILAFIIIALSGCLDPYRVQIHQRSLDASPLDWSVDKRGQSGKTVETIYSFQPDEQPPFLGVIQVFGQRGGGASDKDLLYARAWTAVAESASRQNESIEFDLEKDLTGTRELRNGINTRWFMREGTVEPRDDDCLECVFDPQTTITVRILGEVGYDGKSKTGFTVIAMVKVAEEQPNVVPGLPPQTVADQTTWFDVVADPDGSINGAFYSSQDRGLVYNLKTHG